MIAPLRAIAFSLCLLASPWHAAAAAATSAVKLTPAQLRQDLAFLQQSIRVTHPDLSYSVDPAALDKAYAGVEKKLRKSMTRDEAWRVFGTLNPVFSDAHLQVSMGDFEPDAKAHVAGGGGFFPYEVHVDNAGDVFIVAESSGAPSDLARARIDTINGMPARDVTRQLLALTFGDTPALRVNLLAGRWWRFYWKSFGTPAIFDLTVTTAQGRKKIRRMASPSLPASFGAQAEFDQVYRFEMLPGKVALLTVGSFLWPDKKLFYAMTERAFTAMRAAGASTLIIDVRTNGGGDDDMWKEGLLPYIAGKPYRHGSSGIKKVIEGRQNDTEKLGDIIKLEVKTWHPPQLDHPLRFGGKVYVLMGRTTYSSSIFFINTMQDFKFATLVGEAGSARVRQSGGIQHMVLPNSKWGVIVPRFILDRPSGSRVPELAQPDLAMEDDPFDSRALINALHSRILKEPEQKPAPTRAQTQEQAQEQSPNHNGRQG